MHTIKIDMEKCNGCKQCYRACFVDVIRWDEAAKRPDSQVPGGVRYLQLVRALLPGQCRRGDPG